MPTWVLTAATAAGAAFLAALFAKPSTRRLVREQGPAKFLNLTTLHAYVYLRWTRTYISIAINKLLPLSTEWLRKRWADGYHGKVLTPDHARSIITLNHRIEPRDLEQIIPYPVARTLVLEGPPDVVVHECVCRAARKSPCLPTQVCMVIGKPFTDFILEHNPDNSRRLGRDEALELLRQEHERGHVHVAWFKDVMLDRFYAICNCCSCCCGGMEGMLDYHMTNITPSGHVAMVDQAACTGCGACEQACPFRAMGREGTAKVSWERCMGCGVCGTRCPNNAITMVRDKGKGIPFDVRMLQENRREPS